MAAIEIRRMLLRDAADLRALYKVTALLAKIVLKSEGHDYLDDGDALAAFAELAGLSLAAVLQSDPRGCDHAVRPLAAGVLDWWLDSIRGSP